MNDLYKINLKNLFHLYYDCKCYNKKNFYYLYKYIN